MKTEELEKKISMLIDGELDDAEAAEVMRLVDINAEAKAYLERNKKLKEVFSEMSMNEPSGGKFAEFWPSVSNRLTRGIGWILLIVGVIANIIYALYAFIITETINPLEKVLAFLVISGFVLLFIAVAHQRFVESKTDKYKDIMK